ncbi:hypothetical protein PR048_018490 [Dryococelus australis]|uniref:Uncharacterized protein n=1 Tax=Dryococelus australis TaxID=614101 RepID=A0ABQ9HCE8_9NEOP|nr:hypothetical protein PR048_018490 [Dryococelus australis]
MDVEVQIRGLAMQATVIVVAGLRDFDTGAACIHHRKMERYTASSVGSKRPTTTEGQPLADFEHRIPEEHQEAVQWILHRQ